MSQASKHLSRIGIAVGVALTLSIAAAGGALANDQDNTSAAVNRPTPDSRISVQLWTLDEFVPTLGIGRGAPPPIALLIPAVQSIPPDADR